MTNEQVTAEILGEELTEEHARLIRRAAEFGAYTSTTLLGLEVWLRALDDNEGAELMAAFRKRFAEYEATTI